MERTTTIILSQYKGQRAIHFTEQPLAGKNSNLWFPIDKKDLKKAVTDIMVFNDVALKVIGVKTTGNQKDTSMEIDVSFLGPESAY